MLYSLTLLLILSLSSCILRPQTANKKFITLQHDLRQRLNDSLMNKVHAPHWTIHYSFDRCPPVDAATQVKFTQIVTKFLQSWLQPLREHTARPIVDDFRYKLDADWSGADFGVTHICVLEEAPKAFFGPLGIINPAVGHELTWRGMSSMLHELGHLFGLADTYEGARRGPDGADTGGMNLTRGSQPASFMAGAILTLAGDDVLNDQNELVPLPGLVPLPKDDKNGIIWLYKFAYEGLKMENCFFPNYELVETPFGCEPKHILIFELKQDNEKLALFVLSDDENLDVNAQDADGMSALHHAVLSQFEKVITELLARPNIKPFLRDKQGRTAISLARERGFDKIIALLLSHPLTLSVDAKGKQITSWGAMKKEEQ